MKKIDESKTNFENLCELGRQMMLQVDVLHVADRLGLECDQRYLYINMFGRPYRMSLADAVMEYTDDGWVTAKPASAEDTMTIYDLLGRSKEGCRAAGEYVALGNLRGVVQTRQLSSSFFSLWGERYHGKMPQLHEACRQLGGRPYPVGDVAYEFDLFDFLPMVLQFWEGDEEFPDTLKFLHDANILDFLDYETTYYAAMVLMRRLHQVQPELPV